MWLMAVQSHGKLVLLSSAIAFLAMFQMGYSASYPNTSFAAFKSFVNDSFVERGRSLTDAEFSWLWAFILNTDLVSCMLGTWICPYTAEKFGRKMSLFSSSAIKLIGNGIMIISISYHSPELLGAGRMICGLGDGLAASCLTLFLQETSPTKIRGLVSGFQELSISFSTLTGMIFGLPYVFGNSLSTLIGLAVFPNIALILILFFCPDTPKFLFLERNDKHAAISSLRFYHGTDQLGAVKVLDELEKEKEEWSDGRGTTLRQVFETRHLRKAALLGSVAVIFQILAIIPITFFSTEFLRRAGVSKSAAELTSLCMMVLNCLATALSMNFVDKCGRRQLLLGFGFLNVISLALYATFAELSDVVHWAKYGCIFAMLAFSSTYSFGIGPVPWYLTAELSPQKERSLIQSIAYTAFTVSGLMTGLLTLPLYGYLNAYSFIPLFIIPSIFCLVYLYWQLPETKNKEIHEIVRSLRGRTVTDCYLNVVKA